MTYALIAIGGSLGSFKVVQVVLAALPPTFKVPVVIIVHRERGQEDILAPLLQAHCALPIAEIEDKCRIEPGRIYIAPSGYHVLIEDGAFALSVEAPLHYAQPSIDITFESVAECYGRRAIGVILTGTGQDGAQGMVALKQRGGQTVVQIPASAEAPGMPEAAISTGAAGHVLPPEEIGPFLVKRTEGCP